MRLRFFAELFASCERLDWRFGIYLTSELNHQVAAAGAGSAGAGSFFGLTHKKDYSF
jgi:hypothetical protein